jgi:hypothetical protein
MALISEVSNIDTPVINISLYNYILFFMDRGTEVPARLPIAIDEDGMNRWAV